MLLDEFLISLGLKVDNADIAKAEKFGDSLDDIKDSADQAESSMVRAYDATDGFVSAIEGAMGVIGFFTGVLGGAFAFFHGTIMELEDLIKEEKLLTKITKDQLDQQKKYTESVETLGKRYNSLKVELAFGFLPTLQRMVSGLDDWLKKNKDLIVNGITGLLRAITSILGVVWNFIRFIDLIVEKTLGWEKMLYVLGAALLWVNRAMLIGFATNPVFWIIAAIGVLLILIDDFMTYLDGGQSEFGNFWGAMLEWIDKISPALKSLWDMLILGTSYLIEFGFYVTKYLGGAFVDAVELITAIFTLFAALFVGNTDLMAVAWEGMVDNFLSMFRNFAMLLEPIGAWIEGLIVALCQSIINAVSGAASTVGTVFSQAWNDTKQALSNAVDSMMAVITAFVSGIGTVFSTVFTVITTPFRLAFDWIMEKFSTLPSLIGSIVSKLPGVGAVSAIGSAVSNGVSRITNNYGGNTTATVNVTSPNAEVAGNRVAGALKNTQAQKNMGGQALA